MKKNYYLLKLLSFFLFLIAVLLSGCGTKSLVNGDNGLKQSSEDLLDGEFRAVCYSGFREGQHPDRGKGASNPSDKEILEDLKIIRDEMGFKLIRLYDSGENSAAVLRIINENSFDIKVMLGIWLNAVRDRNPKGVNVPVNVGQRSATVCHLANMAMQLGRELEWDPSAEVFVDDDEANRMISRPLRAPWNL